MYEIKVLSNDEFDKIANSDTRYEYVDNTNLGFADRQKGVAYVRGTNIHDLNKYLISHELEELESDQSTHEDPNGIRHKKGGFMNVFKRIINPLNIPGPLGLFTGRKDEGAFGSSPTSFLSGASRVIAPLISGGFAQGPPVPQPSLTQQGSQQFEGGMPEFAQPPAPPVTASPRATGALSGFSVAGPASQQVSPEVGGNVASVLGGQAFQNPIQHVGNLINPDLAERLRGYYSGRLTF